MNAGAAVVEITPKPGTHLAGSVGRYRPYQAILDPLYARAAVFESGGRKLCFLSLDVTIITQEYTDRIRMGAERLGFDPAAVMVHATQTHSAPAVGHFMVDEEFPPSPPDREFVRGSDLAYAAFAAEQAVEAIASAVKKLEPVQVATGSGSLDGIAFNRRGIMRDGKATMPWLYSAEKFPVGRTDLLNLEGPTDPEVGILCARNAAGQAVAMLLCFTCHPVNVFAQPGASVSADWPGAWSAEMQAQQGSQCVPLVLNGCCGNINPWPAFEADYKVDHARMGRSLAAISSKIAGALRFSDEAALDWKTRIIPLAVREVEASELRAARAFLDRHPEPPWLESNPPSIDPVWNRSAYLWSIELQRRRSATIPCEIQVFRLGNAAFVGLPGEPFVEGQLAIKTASPAAPIHVVHGNTHYMNYFPTAEAYPHGGHEVFFCRVKPGSLETIVEQSRRLVQEMFAHA